MYQGFAHHHSWSFDILEHTTSELGQSTHTFLLQNLPQMYFCHHIIVTPFKKTIITVVFFKKIDSLNLFIGFPNEGKKLK